MLRTYVHIEDFVESLGKSLILVLFRNSKGFLPVFLSKVAPDGSSRVLPWISLLDFRGIYPKFLPGISPRGSLVSFAGVPPRFSPIVSSGL